MFTSATSAATISASSRCSTTTDGESTRRPKSPKQRPHLRLSNAKLATEVIITAKASESTDIDVNELPLSPKRKRAAAATLSTETANEPGGPRKKTSRKEPQASPKSPQTAPIENTKHSRRTKRLSQQCLWPTLGHREVERISNQHCNAHRTRTANEKPKPPRESSR